MKTVLNIVTALATILALSGEAAALGNFPPVKALVHPSVAPPVTAPAPHVNRLTRKPSAPPTEAPRTEEQGRNQRDRVGGGQSPAKQTTRQLPRENLAPDPTPDVARPSVLRAPLPPSKTGGAVEGSPQPEPPTIADSGPGAGQRAGARTEAGGGPHIPGHLREALPHEAVAAMRDLREWLVGRNAIDRGALGGDAESEGGLSDWRRRFDQDEQPSEGAIARATGGAFDARDVAEAATGHDSEEGFRPPRRSSPSLGRPGRAGSELPGNGAASSDGGEGQSQPANAEPETVDSPLKEAEVWSCGANCIEYKGQNQDGETVHGRSYRVFMPDYGPGNVTIETRTRPDGTRTTETRTTTDSGRRWHRAVVRPGPGTQPADPMYGSGGEPILFECFDPVFPCFRPGVDAEDTVSQPGRGGDEEIQPANPSVGERLRAVTQPVPGHIDGTGSGGNGRPRDPCIRAKCNEPLPG